MRCIRLQRGEGRNFLLLLYWRGSSITLIARDRPGLSDCEGIRPRFSWEIRVGRHPPSACARAKKEGNPIWSKWSANWTERAARRQKSARPAPLCIRANSFGRGPQRDTPAAWIVRCLAAISSSPSRRGRIRAVEMESTGSGDVSREKFSLAWRRESNERERGLRVSFLSRDGEKSEGGGGCRIGVTREDGMRDEGTKAKVGKNFDRALFLVFRAIR